MLKKVKVEEGEVLTSFDVSAMFTSIPTKEVVKRCVDQVKKDPTMASRCGFTPEQFGNVLELTLDTTYFQYQGKIYQQTYGAAMGSPLSPVIANIFMEEFVLKVLETAAYPPKFWSRYVDDMGVITKKIHVQVLFDHINQQR